MAHFFLNTQLADIKKGFEHAGNLKYVNYLLVLELRGELKMVKDTGLSVFPFCTDPLLTCLV